MPLSMVHVGVCFVDEAARSGDAVAQDLLMPKQKTTGAAGFDLVAANVAPMTIAPGRYAKVPTGVALELPPGHPAEVRPRSGLAAKHGVTVLNAPGTIDDDYRGEIAVLLINHGAADFVVERGMRIAQLVLGQTFATEFAPAAALSVTERGAGGFGSTGVAS